MAGNFADIIMRAKFADDISGVKIAIFISILALALEHCSTTALPVIIR